jgi:signal transduction histidine kinase
MGHVPRLLRPLIARTTWRRWSYFIVGGALLTPFLVISQVIAALVSGRNHGPWLYLAITLVAVTGPLAIIGLVPAVRVMEGTAATELLGMSVSVGEGRSWQGRLRTSAWFTGHLLLGGAMGIASVAIPVLVGWSFIVPFRSPAPGRTILGPHLGRAQNWLPLVGLLVLAGFLYGIAALGALAARVAPYALGPSNAERLAEVEKRATTLAERNRLARELHDSVGHALSIVTVQAGAAARVLDGDPEFARQALIAIEESARSALEDLDHVLGLLRDEAAGTAPQRTLRDLDELLRMTRMAGASIATSVEGDPGQLPAAVSREAYRIIQEGLTNALKHAGKVPVTLRLTVKSDLLEVEMVNPLGMNGQTRPTGGRGLPGLRERVTVLRGQLSAGAVDGDWRVAVTIPLKRGTQ